MVARGPMGLPGHIADQTKAAGRDMHRAYGRLSSVLPALEPERNWRQRVDLESTDEVRALLLAGLLGCIRICSHLRRGGPRPAYCRLPLGRVDCQRCVVTITHPIVADDQCDLCGSVEVDTFYPFACQRGPLMMAGNVCDGCAEVLGIRFEEAAS
jgi:hypothetical protein